MQYLLSTLNLLKIYLILISEHKNSGIQTSADFPSWLHTEKESVPLGIQTWQNVKNLNQQPQLHQKINPHNYIVYKQANSFLEINVVIIINPVAKLLDFLYGCLF